MLTFEKIRDLERAERESRQMQKLPENFMDELREYLAKKESMKEKTASSILELENAKNTIRRLFEFREKKMAEMVLYTVRTGMPPENLTKKEEQTFWQMVDVMKALREDFFSEMQKEPEQKIADEKIAEEEPKRRYRVVRSLPTFVGTDMKEYRIAENEIISDLPKPLNDLLLKEGVIERLK